LSITAVAAATLVALSLASVARPADVRRTTLCWSGYSYDGAQSPVVAGGVSASIRISGRTAVEAGHVAAWVGVGGPGLGPGGSSEWLQAGIAYDAGGAPALYYELRRPQDKTSTYVALAPVAPGEAHSIVVAELPGQADVWAVAIDGVRVSAPASLPGSHGAFRPVATAESWDGGVSGVCNRYSFDFANVSVRAETGRTWQPFDLSRVLRDPAYILTLRAGGFTAASR
jgi:hypothetical protein